MNVQPPFEVTGDSAGEYHLFEIVRAEVKPPFGSKRTLASPQLNFDELCSAIAGLFQGPVEMIIDEADGVGVLPWHRVKLMLFKGLRFHDEADAVACQMKLDSDVAFSHIDIHPVEGPIVGLASMYSALADPRAVSGVENG